MSNRQFLSWVRRGASVGILVEDPLRGDIPAAPEIRPHLTLEVNDEPGMRVEGPALQLLGPAHVIGFDRQLVRRLQPGDGATDGQSHELAYVEFASAELPWLFTPAAPNSVHHERLRPWIVLIVLPDGSWERFDQSASPLPVLEVRPNTLPDLADSWAWAHTQVFASDEASAIAALRRRDPETRSRLLCPRRLGENSRFRAFVVPAFEGGRRSGLGDPDARNPRTALKPAWNVTRSAVVVLPVYYSWTFATGGREGFEDLASRLQRAPIQALKGFGTREIDVRRPWPALPPLPRLTGEDEGSLQTIALDGALKIPGPPPEGSMTAASRAKFEALLEKQLNFVAAAGRVEPDPELRSVNAPIYGSRFRGLPKLPDAEGWLRDLNVDIRRRIAAAFGTRYVQENQEFLMARAWEQLPAIEEANRLRRVAELAAVAADAMRRRHIETLTPAELIAVASPARARTRLATGMTLRQTVAASPLPNAAATPAFTRVAGRRRALAISDQEAPLRRIVVRGLSGEIAVNQRTTLSRRLSIVSPAAALAQDGTGSRAATASLRVSGTEKHAVAIGLSSLQRVVDARGTQATTALASANRFVEQRLSGVLTAEMLRTDAALDIADRLKQPADVSAAIAAVKRFGDHLIEATGSGVILKPEPPPPPLPGTPMPANDLRIGIAAVLMPSRLIASRLADRMTVPPEMQPPDPLGPVMAAPRFEAPLALPLFQRRPELLLPGIGSFPPDSVTLLETNPPFIESLLVGANHEMNRELLWREFPTDQRGTPFRHFWPRLGNAAEINPISSWIGRLGGNLARGVGEQIVLLVRGELLRRFPGTIVFAAPARRTQTSFELVDDRALPPEFALRLTEDTSIYAFKLTEEMVRSSAAQDGWFFVFQEPLTTPRFGFDLGPSAVFASWDDLTWDRVPKDRQFALASQDLESPPDAADALWNRSAADVAKIAMQRPFRVGFHADVLLRVS